MTEISIETFVKRFTTILLQGKDFPKKEQDVHVLLKSATLRLQAGRTYTEKELNAELQVWVMQFGIYLVDVNYVALRRYLVDTGYLSRDAAGSSYTLNMKTLPFSFDTGIETLDLVEKLEQEKQARELRKQEFMNKKS